MAAKKKSKQHGGNKPHGHYCRICGEHKANEKFSGKGHAAHICKACAALSPAERSEQTTLRKIEGMAFRYLSEQEIKWLRGKMNDKRPEVSEAARNTHGMKFPRYERSQIKKGLTAFSLELFLDGEVWDEWGDEIPVHVRVEMDDTGLIRRTDYDAPENGRETEITIDRQDARRFLKAVIHELDALFWDEDLSDAGPDDDDFDPFSDEDTDEAEDETAPEPVPAEQGEPERPPDESRLPLWSLRLELNNGEDKAMTFYNQMHDEPQSLYWSLMECFEPDEDDIDEDEYESDVLTPEE